MFQLSREELENWKSQIVISNPAAKMALRKPSRAFTEHGGAMFFDPFGSRINLPSLFRLSIRDRALHRNALSQTP
jgi:hypothetical protein